MSRVGSGGQFPLGFGGALGKAELYATNSAGKRIRRKHAKSDPGCASCGLGQWSCSKRKDGCCADCFHLEELPVRETRAYSPAGERVEHADGLAVAISRLPGKARRAWMLRYGGLEWEWKKDEVNNPEELRRRTDGDWYKVAYNVVEAQFKVYMSFEKIAEQLGVCVSTAHRWVKDAERAIAGAWI